MSQASESFRTTGTELYFERIGFATNTLRSRGAIAEEYAGNDMTFDANCGDAWGTKSANQ